MKTILFDFNGVVTATPDGGFQVIKSILSSFMDVEVNRAFKDLQHRRMLEKDFWQKFGMTHEQGKEALSKAIKINPKLHELAAYLKRKNYVLVLFTDFPKQWIDYLAKEKDLLTVFDKIVSIPYEGFAKNQLPGYTWAAKEFGDCVIVDDHLEPLTLANQAGIETIWKKNIEEETSFEPDHVIRYLEELKDIL